jgi:hypothetical protein
MSFRIAFSTLILSFSVSAFASTKIYLDPTQARGLNAVEDLSEIVDDLIVQEAKDYEDVEIIESEQDANLKFFPKLISTSSKYILSIKVIRSKRGGSFNEYSYLNSIDELNEAVPELVDKVFAKVDVTATQSQSTSTPMYQNLSLRKDPESFWYFGMGPANPSGLQNRQSMSQWTLGYAWLYDSQILRLELESASTQNSEDYYMSGWGFTGMQMLTSGKTLLFLSGTLQNGGFNYMDTQAEEQEINGFILGSGLGCLFWTGSSKLIEVSLYYRVLLAKVDGATPNITGLKVGIFW